MLIRFVDAWENVPWSRNAINTMHDMIHPLLMNSDQLGYLINVASLFPLSLLRVVFNLNAAVVASPSVVAPDAVVGGTLESCKFTNATMYEIDSGPTRPHKSPNNLKIPLMMNILQQLFA